MENKLALTIGESLEWSKSKFNLICSFWKITILLNKSTCFFEICIFQLGTFFTQNGNVNNVYAFQKKAVSVVRIIGDGGGDGLKKIGEIFGENF